MESKIYCNECEREIKPGEWFGHDGRNNTVCSGCLSYYVTCDECGDSFPQDDMAEVDNQYVCPDCLNDLYWTCDDCCQLIHNEDAIHIDRYGRDVCGDCLNGNYCTCCSCGEYIDCEDTISDDTGMELCPQCYEMEYFTCEDCGRITAMEYSYERNGCYYCDSCAPDDTSEYINDYSYKPRAIFFGEALGYYGLEVEIDDGREMGDCAAELVEFEQIYLKKDGSLSERGIEIVTHPASLDYHMNHFPWSDICDTAREYGYKSHNTTTCGLHIHASRSLFGEDDIQRDLTIAKIMLIFDQFWTSHVVPFSRRDISKLDQWAQKPNAKITPVDTEGEALDKVTEKKYSGRYQAINLQNQNTIEFRIFRGTLRRDTIIASIQFIHTLIEYAKAAKLRDFANITWGDIFTNTEYSELKEYMTKKNLLGGM